MSRDLPSSPSPRDQEGANWGAAFLQSPGGKGWGREVYSGGGTATTSNIRGGMWGCGRRS